MKELSIEDKAKRYDEAIEKAKDYYHLGDDKYKMAIDAKAVMEYIFPELKESEDERMIQYFKDLAPFDKADELYEKYGFSHKDAIAWLEKQAEHANFRNKIQIGDKVTRNEDGVLVNLSQLKRIAKPAENKSKHGMGISEATKQKLEDNLNNALEKETPESLNEFLDEQCEKKPVPKFKIGDTMRTLQEAKDGWTDGMPFVVSIDSEYYNCNSEKIAIKDQDEYEYPPMNRRQKPAWSEEDDKIIEEILNDIECARVINYHTPIEDYEFRENWLKSIKDRYTWKPSDEQMEALKEACDEHWEPDGLDPLYMLWEQLKKLK